MSDINLEQRIEKLEELLASHGISLPEQPRHWRWVNGQWEEDGDRNSVKASRYSCTVFGTTSDRDAKRDLVLEAMESVTRESWIRSNGGAS